jgi:hypothetical protein
MTRRKTGLEAEEPELFHSYAFKKMSRHHCKCVTAGGSQCTRYALDKSKYCWQHQNCKQKSGRVRSKDTGKTGRVKDDSFDTQVKIPSVLKKYKYVYTAGSSPSEVSRFYMIPHETLVDLLGIENGKRKVVQKAVVYRKLLRQLKKKRSMAMKAVLAGQNGKYDIQANKISLDPVRDVLERDIVTPLGTSLPPQIRKNGKLVKQLPELSAKQAYAIYDNSELVFIDDVVKSMK